MNNSQPDQGSPGLPWHREPYYQDHDVTETGAWYYLWRFLDKMFADRHGHYAAEIASLDTSRMPEKVLYLLKHMLVNKGVLERTIAEYPNLAALREAPDQGHTIILSADPDFIYDYYTEHGIYL